MNGRQAAHRAWRQLRGDATYRLYDYYRRECVRGIQPETSQLGLSALLAHAATVPYYADFLSGLRDEDPYHVLSTLPLLTKQIIRDQLPRLCTHDLRTRKWRFNTSGGSTGEPVRFVQDVGYNARTNGLTMLYSHLVGQEFGQSELRLWGAERDILEGGVGAWASVRAWASNTATVNAFRMTPASMNRLVGTMNRRPPRLILAYAQAIYELAVYAESAGLRVRAQRAVMTSAGTLYPFMRERIERVFACPVFNRYGSREVGDIACETPLGEGLWIAPWGVHVEVLGEDGAPLPDGEEGELVVTSLCNYAMPLIRYRIGDRGSLAPMGVGWQGRSSRSFVKITGRTVDAFRLLDGTLIDGEYFTHLLYYRDWVQRFQVVQVDYQTIVIRIVAFSTAPSGAEDEIAFGVRAVMGDSCSVRFEYPAQIASSASGKYRYTVSELQA